MRCAFWESNKRSIAVDEKEGGVGSTSAAEDFLAKRTVASFKYVSNHFSSSCFFESDFCKLLRRLPM